MKYRNMNFVRILLFVLFLPILGGCAVPTTYSVSADSICAETFSPTEKGKKYFLLPDANKKMKIDDLAFKEVKSELQKAFDKNGMIITDNIYDADYAVFIDFGIGNPKDHQATYSVPEYGITGYAQSSTYGTYNAYSGQFSSTTYNTPIYGQTGSHDVTERWTTYNRWLKLVAYALNHKKKDIENQVWQTSIESRGSTDDFRLILPIMVEVLKKDIASNTRRKINYDVRITEGKDGQTMTVTQEN